MVTLNRLSAFWKLHAILPGKVSFTHYATSTAIPKKIPSTRGISPSSFVIRNYREQVLFANALEKFGAYNTHLFPEIKHKIGDTDLVTLSSRMRDAVSTHDISALTTLGKQVPKDKEQLKYLKGMVIKSAGVTLLAFQLQQNVSSKLDRLTGNCSNAAFVEIIDELYSFNWLFSSNKIDISDIILAFDRLITNRKTDVQVSTWCYYMQWRATVNTHPTKLLVETFCRNILRCQSVSEFLASTYVLSGNRYSKLITPLYHTRIADLIAELVVQHKEAISTDITLLAALSITRHNLDLKSRSGPNRVKYSMFLWDSISKNMSHSESELSNFSVNVCLKDAISSLSKSDMKNRPELFHKTFSAIEAIFPTLYSQSPVMAIKLLYGTVQCRHVNLRVTKMFEKGIRNLDWSTVRSKEVALAVLSMVEYGCLEKEIYESVMKNVMSSGSRMQFDRYPECLLTLLTGLAYIRVFPTNLCAQLFELVEEPVGQKRLSSKHHMMKLYSLDHYLDRFCPTYNGKRLSSHTKQRAINMKHKEITSHADGSPTLRTQMYGQTKTCLESISEVTEKYIIQGKVLNEQDFMKDILLTPMGQEKKVAIFLMDETYFMRLYDDKSDKSPSLRMLGYHKMRVLERNNPGCTSIMITFAEYLKATNTLPALIMNKLREAKAI